jgi:hypothetical protein
MDTFKMLLANLIYICHCLIFAVNCAYSYVVVDCCERRDKGGASATEGRT